MLFVGDVVARVVTFATRVGNVMVPTVKNAKSSEN